MLDKYHEMLRRNKITPGNLISNAVNHINYAPLTLLTVGFL